MGKEKLDINKPTFRPKSENVFYHKGYFLHYINDLAPEVSAELKKLTSSCEELFGKFPVSIETLSDWANLGVWFNEPYDDKEQRQLWLNITGIFRDCIWKGSRDNFGTYTWRMYLLKEDNNLKKALEIEEKYVEIVSKHVEKEMKEKLDVLKSAYSAATEGKILPEDVGESAIEFWLGSSSYQWLWENEESYRTAKEIEWAKIGKLREFQNAFDDLLTKFCLEKGWLAESVFRAIWNGTGKLQMQNAFVETFSEELLDELRKKLDQKKNAFQGIVRLPNANPFVYEKPYSVFSGDELYKEKAVEAYRQHLDNYFEVIKESLKKHDYKLTQGDNYDYERVRWLVLWNIQDWKMIDFFTEKHPNKTKELAETLQNFSQNTHRMFREFEDKYDLPRKRTKHTRG